MLCKCLNDRVILTQWFTDQSKTDEEMISKYPEDLKRQMMQKKYIQEQYEAHKQVCSCLSTHDSALWLSAPSESLEEP